MNLKYLNGIYQAKTTSILKQEDFDALEKLSHYNFLNYLRNADYGRNSNYETIDDVLTNESISVREELNQLTNKTIFGDVIFVKNDLNNFKIVYKSNKFDIPIENQDDISRFSIEAIEQYIKYDNTSLINDEDLLLLENIKKINESNVKNELQTIEKNVYEYHYDKIKNDYKPLATYIETKNFINNLNTFLKLRTRKVSKDILKNALLYQTTFPTNEWLEMFDKTDAEIIEKISLQYYGKLTEAVTEYLVNDKTNLLGSSTNKILNELVQELSYNHNGIGPIIHYIHLKIDEINNVRRLYYAKNK